MKKKIIYLTAAFLILISGSNIFAHDIDGKVGASYVIDQEAFGLDIMLDYNYELDPFFTVGGSFGCLWLRWVKKLDDDEIEDESNLNSKAEETINAYMYPLLLTAQVRLINFKEKIGITPYFGGGLGASVMAYSYNNGEKDVVDWFSGFTWMINAGVTYSPGASSNIEFLGDFAYRGAELSEGNRTVDMSSAMFHIGVRYLFDAYTKY